MYGGKISFYDYVSKRRNELTAKQNKLKKRVLAHSSSDTDLIVDPTGHKDPVIYSTENNPPEEEKVYWLNQINLIHKKVNKKYVSPYRKLKRLFRNDSTHLTQYINKNYDRLKLFGNRRYNKKPPKIFVRDVKYNTDINKLGLIPLPKKVLLKNQKDNRP